MARKAGPPVLPSPEVAFAPDFLPRLGRLTVRLASARERREGAGSAGLHGVGSEFVGFRPYRPGEDLRQLDWNLYARMRRPFVRLARREASEHWTVLLDTSASMGVGRPGKLQCAAEVATAIASVGLKEGAAVQLLDSGVSDAFTVRRPSELTGWMRTLEGRRAAGDGGLASLVREPARFRNAGGLFLLGDLLDLEPREALSLARRGRQLFCGQILAPEELAPPPGPVRWVDAETGHARAVDVDRATRGAYLELLGRRLESWGAACARHRAVYGTWTSATPFETITASLFGG